MKDKQKQIDPLNVFVICVAIMVLVTAIINGAIKANAQGIKQIISFNGVNENNRISQWLPYNEKVCALGNKTGEYNGVNLYTYTVYTDYQETYYTTQYQYGDVIGEWTNQLTNTDIKDSNNNTVKRVSLSQGIWGNNSLTGIPVFTQLNQVENYFLTGSEEGNINRVPLVIYDSDIPSPDVYYVYDNLQSNDQKLTDKVHYNNRGNYKVGLLLRYHFAMGKTASKITNSLRYRITWDNEVITDWKSIYSRNDNYVPDNNEINLAVGEIISRFSTDYIDNWYADTQGMQAAIRTFSFHTAYLSWHDGYNNVVWNPFISPEIMTYYYFVDDNGDTHIGNSTALKKEIPAFVDADFSGGMRKFEWYQTSTEDITMEERDEYLENDKEVKNETTSTNQTEVNKIEFGDVDTALTSFNGVFNSIVQFIGDVPSMFSKIFGFFPDWILNLIYVSLGLSLIVGIIKLIRG